jgi:hypothetical protein
MKEQVGEKEIARAKAFLKAIIANNLSVLTSDANGVCYNLNEKTFLNAYKFVGNNVEDWKLYSGDTCEPVSNPNSDHKWSGEQLKLRKSLCKHLLSKLEMYV